MRRDTTSQEFFDQKYRKNSDPWNFKSSDYEQSRYTATVNALNWRRYQRAFEPGCSIGILTSRLADFCDQVEATEISPTAVQKARELCEGMPNVNVTCGALPDFIPSGSFDLIVLSEIGYYFDERRLEGLGNTLVHRLCESGTLLATHWLGTSEDHLLSGDRVHEVLGKLEGMSHDYSERYPGFRLDRWRRI